MKAKVKETFVLKDFDKLKNLKRADKRKNQKGWLYANDELECDENMFEYLNGKNVHRKSYVSLIEEISEVENIEKTIERIEESAKEEVKLNELGNPVGTREIKTKKKKTTKKNKKEV